MEKHQRTESTPATRNPLAMSAPQSSFITSILNVIPNLIKQIISFILGTFEALNPWRYSASGFIIPRTRMTMILEFPVVN